MSFVKMKNTLGVVKMSPNSLDWQAVTWLKTQVVFAKDDGLVYPGKFSKILLM